MKQVYDAEFFDGKCPYTGKPCYEWECNSCEVEAQEEIDPQSGYDMLEDIQFIRGFINKHKPQESEE